VGWIRSNLNEVRRLKQRLLGTDVLSIKQESGSVVTFDAKDVSVATFKYFLESLMADADRGPRPEPPEVLKAVANAVDRRYAVERVMNGYNHLPVDPDVLIEEGRFEPISMVAGYDTYEEYLASGGVKDLSE
jgi:hypothetical protein